MSLRFEICDADGYQPYYWRIVDGDKILAKSETMHNKADAFAAARKMKENTAAYTFEVFRTNDQAYPFSWHAYAANNRLVVSANYRYQTYSDASTVMNYVKTNAVSAVIVDKTRTAIR